MKIPWARVAMTDGWRKTLQQDWHDYDPIALAVLFLSIVMVALAIGIHWTEKVMSKTNETSNLATLKHNDTLTDSELDAVSGGSSGAYDQWQLPGASHASSDNPLIQAFLDGFYRNCGCWWEGAGGREFLMEKIMNKTTETSKLEHHNTLADSELDAVTGGLVVNAIIMPLIALDIGRPPANAAAMAAWNGLLKQNGFWWTGAKQMSDQLGRSMMPILTL
jgi:hypothetical protein